MDVHVVGNSVVDLLVAGTLPDGPAAAAWTGNVTLLPRPVDVTLGGGGAAAAYVLGRLGAAVALSTNLGDDAWGGLVRAWLQDGGVNLAAAPCESTAVHVIMLDAAGARRSLYYTGERVDWSSCVAAPAPRWMLASGHGGVEAGDLLVLTRLFAAQRERGARIMFDPGPWFQDQVTREQMVEAWGQVDCLAATEDELLAWLPGARGQDVVAAALDAGAGLVVSKRGPAGAAYGTADGSHGEVATVPVPRRNTVGAGDTFNGRLVYGLASGEALQKAVRASVALATAAVRTGRGVLGAFPRGGCKPGGRESG